VIDTNAPTVASIPVTRILGDETIISRKVNRIYRICALNGSIEGARYEISGNMIVGRDVSCDLILEHAGISRKHSSLSVDGDRLKIKDMGSAYGTYVNGSKISEAYVRDGDEIKFNEMAFRLEIETIGGRDDLVANQTIAVDAPIGEKTLRERWRTTSIPSPKLYAKSGDVAGEIYQITGHQAVAGRKPGMGIVIDDSTISGEHARFTFSDNRWRVEDLGSRNYTYVNGEKVNNAALSN